MRTRLTLLMVIATMALGSGTALADGLRIKTPTEEPPAAPDVPDVPDVPESVGEAVEEAKPALRLLSPDEKKKGDEKKTTAGVEESSEQKAVACGYWGRSRSANDPTGIEFGLRLGSFVVSDDWITGDESALYGGIGYHMRYRFLPHWGLELGMDILGRESESGRVSEVRFNGSLGGVYYFNTDWIQGYTTFGLAFNSTQLDFEGTVDFSGSYEEYGAYSGIGAELFLDDWRIDTELRLVTLSRSDDEEYPWNGPYSREAPDFRVAVQWFLGVSYSLW